MATSEVDNFGWAGAPDNFHNPPPNNNFPGGEIFLSARRDNLARGEGGYEQMRGGVAPTFRCEWGVGVPPSSAGEGSRRRGGGSGWRISAVCCYSCGHQTLRFVMKVLTRTKKKITGTFCISTIYNAPL